jgi:hypothetical protein
MFADSPFASKAAYSFPAMNWPFASWGAHFVVANGPKFYERITLTGGIPLFVVGNAAATLDSISTPVSGSQVRLAERGILFMERNSHSLQFYMLNNEGIERDYVQILGADTGSIYNTLRYKKTGGLKAGADGAEVSFGNAEGQALSGPTLWQKIQEGSWNRVDTLPTLGDVLAWPYLKKCVFLLGDDPVTAYYWNNANESFDILVTAPGASYHNGSKTQLPVPTFDPVSGETAGVAINHLYNDVEIWYSVNGGSFVQLASFPTDKRVFFDNGGAWWIAAFARRTGDIDSEVSIANYVSPFEA